MSFGIGPGPGGRPNPDSNHFKIVPDVSRTEPTPLLDVPPHRLVTIAAGNGRVVVHASVVDGRQLLMALFDILRTTPIDGGVNSRTEDGLTLLVNRTLTNTHDNICAHLGAFNPQYTSRGQMGLVDDPAHTPRTWVGLHAFDHSNQSPEVVAHFADEAVIRDVLYDAIVGGRDRYIRAVTERETLYDAFLQTIYATPVNFARLIRGFIREVVTGGVTLLERPDRVKTLKWNNEIARHTDLYQHLYVSAAADLTYQDHVGNIVSFQQIKSTYAAMLRVDAVGAAHWRSEQKPVLAMLGRQLQHNIALITAEAVNANIADVQRATTAFEAETSARVAAQAAARREAVRFANGVLRASPPERPRPTIAHGLTRDAIERIRASEIASSSAPPANWTNLIDDSHIRDGGH